MTEANDIGLSRFLRTYPRMAIRPVHRPGLTLVGHFDFVALADDGARMSETFRLKIRVPDNFPRDLPITFETGGRIPATGEYHVNSDGSLCLGSPLRLLCELDRQPTLSGYAANCLVPYLFATSVKLKNGGPFAFGELPHGTAGALNDYADMMGLDDGEQAWRALKYLGMKKRRANKLPCPCGCGQRLGACRFNARLRQFRRIASRRCFRGLLRELEPQR